MTFLPTAIAGNGKNANVVVRIVPNAEMTRWCRERMPDSFVRCMGSYRFVREEDAVLFVLRWSP